MIGQALLMSTFLRNSRYSGSPRPMLMMPPRIPRTRYVVGISEIAVMSDIVNTKTREANDPPPAPRAPSVSGLKRVTSLFCTIPVMEKISVDASTASSPIGISGSLHHERSSLIRNIIQSKASPNTS